MGWLITVGILALLAVLPLGIRIRYNDQGLMAAAVIGPVRFTVYPTAGKKKKKNPPPKAQRKEKSSEQENLPQPPQPPKPAEGTPKVEKGGSLLDFLPLVRLALEFLGDLRRKIRIPKLQGRLILGGDDPCDLAVNYGRACGALASLIPHLERLFVIGNRDLEVACDFTASQTLVIAHVEVTITLGRLLQLAVAYGIRGILEFLHIQKKRKGGAVT